MGGQQLAPPTDPNRLGGGTCTAGCHPAGMHNAIAADNVLGAAHCKRKCEDCALAAHSLPLAVNGSVRCLAMFVDEQGDEQVRRSAAAQQCKRQCLYGTLRMCVGSHVCG